MKKNYHQPITEFVQLEPHALMGTAGPSSHPFMVPGVKLPTN